MKYIKVKRTKRKRVQSPSTIIKGVIKGLPIQERIELEIRATKRLGRPLTSGLI